MPHERRCGSCTTRRIAPPSAAWFGGGEAGDSLAFDAEPSADRTRSHSAPCAPDVHAKGDLLRDHVIGDPAWCEVPAESTKALVSSRAPMIIDTEPPDPLKRRWPFLAGWSVAAMIIVLALFLTHA